MQDIDHCIFQCIVARLPIGFATDQCCGSVPGPTPLIPCAWLQVSLSKLATTIGKPLQEHFRSVQTASGLPDDGESPTIEQLTRAIHRH